ncbi:MAG: molecular chaperone TorD family protein [Opitutaceae bacterium]|jgi:TorA maturation chaperone TorD|nr:molecular chaperone TorD family protein [Opitutaceae bacterium]
MPTRSDTVAAAVARSFAYRFLAEAFAAPEPEGWNWLGSPTATAQLSQALTDAWPATTVLPALGGTAVRALAGTDPVAAARDHLAAFGYTVRSACPPHEIEYGDTKADALFRPHRLADLVALYRAFGLEIDEAVHERADHLAIECEFASILAARAAYALEQQLPDAIAVCAQARVLFLREHFGRWVPAFLSRLRSQPCATWLQHWGNLLDAVLAADCAQAGVTPGSSELRIHEWDETEAALCNGECGLASGVGGIPD